jgi:hypothetical protein
MQDNFLITLSGIKTPNAAIQKKTLNNPACGIPKTDPTSNMGDAAEPPAVTHFGRDNLNASGPVIDLVAEDDLPPTESLKSDDDWVYPFPTDFKIQEHPIDEVRPLKVGDC